MTRAFLILIQLIALCTPVSYADIDTCTSPCPGACANVWGNAGCDRSCTDGGTCPCSCPR